MRKRSFNYTLRYDTRCYDTLRYDNQASRQKSKRNPVIVTKCIVMQCIVMQCIVMLLSSCSKDENSIPSYRTDLVCAIINGDSMVSSILLDNGQRLDVSSQKLRSVYANDTVRCISAFMVNADSLTAHVYEIKQISAYAPLPADSFKILPHDPVSVKSVWKSGGYVNMYLSFLTNGVTDKNHYDFSIDSITSHTMHVSLLFKRDSTVLEAYTKSFYHSLPLHSSEYKQNFDSLILYINTKDGVKAYPFKR